MILKLPDEVPIFLIVDNFTWLSFWINDSGGDSDFCNPGGTCQRKGSIILSIQGELGSSGGLKHSVVVGTLGEAML